MSKTTLEIKGDNNNTQWYRLDNAAKIFPAVLSTRVTTVFRISLTLKNVIKLAVLQQALENIITRFPYYKVHLKGGLFWYYFETNHSVPTVFPELPYPCSKITLKPGVFPFRVIAYGQRIAVEFSHMLTDGTGALIFLKALTGEYISLCGVEIDDWGDIFRTNQTPDEAEFEYSFVKNYRKGVPGPQIIGRAFHLPFQLIEKGVYSVITGIIAVDDILASSKKFGVSISVFLASVLIDSIYKLYQELPEKQRKKPIRILLAVNLRNLYKSITMRNFTLFIIPEIDPRLGEFTFEEILNRVHHYVGMEVNKKFVSRQLSLIVGTGTNPVGRLIPRKLKDLFFSTIYKIFGDAISTCSFSNIGNVQLPSQLANEIERFDFIPAPSPVAKSQCSVISYQKNMYISFGRLINETILEQYFFSKLVELGLSVKVETN